MVKTLLAKKVTIALSALNHSICRTNDTFRGQSPYLGKRGNGGNGGNRSFPSTALRVNSSSGTKPVK
jgi:hypothetical protein